MLVFKSIFQVAHHQKNLAQPYFANLKYLFRMTDIDHYKHSKMTIFEYALTQERKGTAFSGVRP